MFVDTQEHGDEKNLEEENFPIFVENEVTELNERVNDSLDKWLAKLPSLLSAMGDEGSDSDEEETNKEKACFHGNNFWDCCAYEKEVSLDDLLN